MLEVDFLLDDDWEYDNILGSRLYSFLTRNYMFNDMEIILSTGERIFVEKYNVIGFNNPKEMLNIYECNGKTNNPIKKVLISEIKQVNRIGL